MTRIRMFRMFHIPGARLAEAFALAPGPRRAAAALGLAVLLSGASVAHAQAVYPTPEAAVDAFVDALATASRSQIAGALLTAAVRP